MARSDLPPAAQIMADAKDHFGKAEALAIALEKEVGRRYSESNVSKWVRGTNEPPFEVILAAVRLARIPLDDYLHPATDQKDRERLQALEAQMEEQRAQLTELFVMVADLTDAVKELRGKRGN